MKKMLPPVIAAVILLIFITPVVAAAPTITIFHFEDPNAYVMTCDGFRVLESYVTDWTLFDYYDSEGNLDRQVGHVKASGMLYNSRNPEYFVAYSSNTYKHIYEGGYKKGESDTIVGTYYKLTLPGYGDIFLEVGRMTISRRGDVVFKAGPGDYSSGEAAALCAYLSGQ